MSGVNASVQYDPARERQATRSGRFRGCRVYIPADVLRDAGIDPDGPPPLYRLTGRPHSRNTGRVLVSLTVPS